MSVLEIRQLQKTYANAKTPAVSGLDLDVQQGEIVSLLGSSGCGKTTTLRCVAGLEKPNGGSIAIGDRRVYSDRGDWVAPEKRGLSMVFQQYALWPHMSVFENVAFGLRAQHFSKADIQTHVETALKRIRLWNERDRRIGQLSGGQQQRIALARAIAVQPKIVLFDEPLSNLDANLREKMRLLILELHADLQFTALYVTHDQEEALSLSSRIVVMSQGHVEQVATPSELWRRPATSFVAGFVGNTNRFTGILSLSGGRPYIETDTGVQLFVGDTGDLADRARVDAYIRTPDIAVAAQEFHQDVNVWKLPVEVSSFQGDYTMVRLTLGTGRLNCHQTFTSPTDTPFLFAHIEPADVMVFPASPEPGGQHL